MRKLMLLATMLALVLAMMALSSGTAFAQSTNNGTVHFDNSGKINIKATCSNVQLANIVFGNDANRICNNQRNNQEENEFRGNNQENEFFGNNQEDEFFNPFFTDGFFNNGFNDGFICFNNGTAFGCLNGNGTF